MDINSSCTKCINDNLDINSSCTKCINNNLDINSSCTKCINHNLDIKYSCTKCTRITHTGQERDNLVTPDCIKCANDNMDADRNCEFINCNNIINENTCNNNTNDYCAWEDEQCKVKENKPCRFNQTNLECINGYNCLCPNNPCFNEDHYCI